MRRKPCRGVSHNVYAIKKLMDDSEAVNRRAGSGRKTVVDRDSLRDAIRSSLRMSMRLHARRLEVGATIQCNKLSLEAKSLVIVERPLLTPAILSKRLQHCQILVSDLKSTPAGKLIDFVDEKTWTVDSVEDRRDDLYLSLEEE